MSSVNIRTINGAKHNGHLPAHLQRVQNRAAAVLDAWIAIDESCSFDIVAHLHRISIDQIEKDLYGDITDLRKRFGKSLKKFQGAIQQCVTEIEGGINPALVAVAHHIPFSLLHDIQNTKDVQQSINNFFLNIAAPNPREEQTTNTDSDFTIDTTDSSTRTFLRPSVSSVERERNNLDSIGDKLDVNALSSVHPEENILLKRKRQSSSLPIVSHSPSSYEHNDTVSFDFDVQQLVGTSMKRFKKLFHGNTPITRSQLKMEWSITHVHGVGLNNTDKAKKCLNICYINGIIQCLANIPPFVQWLLDDHIHHKCTFTINNEFCSCCVLRSIIKNIHINSNNPCKSFRELSQASAVSMAQQITNLSSNFISGRQEDPSEFLLILLDHLAQCLSCSDSPSYSTHSTNPIHLIFGITIESSIKCTQCLNDSVQKNYESIWTIPIILYSSVEEAISAFCSTEDIGSDDLFTCSQCQRNVIALKTTQIIDASPVICIQLKRFIYDKEAKNIRKVKKYISYPEILDLTSCISKEILQSDKENCQINQFIYQLNAVVVHIGETVNSGHIHSYIKSPDALWYKADDELITKIDLSKVLADNDSYILFYTKFTNEKIIQWESQCSTPFKKSSNLILSSTPAHLGEQSLETFDDDTTIAKNFTLNISRIDDELQTEVSTDDNRNSTINSLNIHENTCNSNAPLKHAIPLQTHLFQEDIAEAIEVQTESRIEIIPRKNLNSEHSNCLMSSGPSRSSLKFETPHSGVSTKKQVVFVNDFSESSIDSTLHDISSEMSTVSPQNVSNQDVQDNDNFHIQLSSSYQFKLEPIDLVRLKSIQTTKLKKKHDRMCEAMGLFLGFNDKPRKKIFLSKEAKETSSSVNNSAIGSDSLLGLHQEKNKSRVDVEYLYILLPYLRRVNPYCGLCVRNCSFGCRTGNLNQLLRCMLYCIGRRTSHVKSYKGCPFSCSIVVLNNGNCHINVTNTTIVHPRGYKICRPIREPIRSLIKKQFSAGASVYRLHKEYLQKRTSEQIKGYNYDGIGRSRDIFTKIKSENVNEALLASDVDEAIHKLHERFKNEINISGKVQGAIQVVSKHPCQII
ncbi:unnamed protein product, partial [Rotaria sp. Silwood2]